MASIIFSQKTQENVHRSCENVSICYCTDQKDVAKNANEVDQELGGGELSLSKCLGVWNSTPRKKKMQIPGMCPGAMVSSKIEPCIIQIKFWGCIKNKSIA